MNENIEECVIHSQFVFSSGSLNTFQNLWLMHVIQISINVTEHNISSLSLYIFISFLQFLSSLLNENEKF